MGGSRRRQTIHGLRVRHSVVNTRPRRGCPHPCGVVRGVVQHGYRTRTSTPHTRQFFRATGAPGQGVGGLAPPCGSGLHCPPGAGLAALFRALCEIPGAQCPTFLFVRLHAGCGLVSGVFCWYSIFNFSTSIFNYIPAIDSIHFYISYTFFCVPYSGN